MSQASKHADLLNDLDQMAQSVAYAVRRHTLRNAELVIVKQEGEITSLSTRLADSEKALREFGRHDATCEYVTTDSADHPGCDCGFSAALAAKP